MFKETIKIWNLISLVIALMSTLCLLFSKHLPPLNLRFTFRRHFLETPFYGSMFDESRFKCYKLPSETSPSLPRRIGKIMKVHPEARMDASMFCSWGNWKDVVLVSRITNCVFWFRNDLGVLKSHKCVGEAWISWRRFKSVLYALLPSLKLQKKRNC